MKTYSKAYKPIRKIGLALCKRFPRARFLRYAYWKKRAQEYKKLAQKAETNEKSVVFEAFGGRKYVCSPKALYLAMCADPRFDDWTFYWSFKGRHVKKMRRNPELARATVVMRGSEAYFDAFATSKYWIQNNRVPEYLAPREDQVYVQCWHGTPLKRLGYDVPETTVGGALNSARELAERFELDSQKWTYLLSPSAYTSRHLCDAFGVKESVRDDVVIEEGYPRNDGIKWLLGDARSQEKVDAYKEQYGVPLGKKALLFAPTWRDDQYTEGIGYTLKMPIDFDYLQEKLGDEWVIMLRTHYYIANKFDLSSWEGFVVNVSRVQEINHLYCMADAICTDYSSVFYDYANTGRPVYFYWPDRKHYEEELHGFYVDADTLPGPKCETPEELVDALNDYGAWHERYGSEYADFVATYCPKDDGCASDRVIERVFFDSNKLR